MKLRHIHKVHAVPACQQCKRQEKGGDDGQNTHHVILFLVLLHSVKLPEALYILLEQPCMIAQPLGTHRISAPLLGAADKGGGGAGSDKVAYRC